MGQLGTGEVAIFIDTGVAAIQEKTNEGSTPSGAPSIDQDFLTKCSVHLPPEKVGLIAKLLVDVRKHFDDALIEGNSRKWTTSPRNFLAITIQNQNLQFLISVKADLKKQSYLHIKPKVSRRPYAEFHVHSEYQLEETIAAILISGRF